MKVLILSLGSEEPRTIQRNFEEPYGTLGSVFRNEKRLTIQTALEECCGSLGSVFRT